MSEVGQDRPAPVANRRPTGGLLLTACLSTLVVNANTSAVSILLPAISEDTGSPISILQWAVTGYSLVGAAVIVTAGALADVYGRRRVFLLGLALFIASCVLIGLSNSGAMVIVGRLIQGAAGSTILACGLSLLTVGSAGQGRMRAVSLWGAASAVGAAAGPLVGGVLVDVTGWQGLFWIDAAVAAVCVPVTLRTVSESRDPERPRSIDWLGTGLVAAILAPFILAVSQGPAWGWTSPATIGCLVVSVVAAYGFLAAERRVSAPLVDLALLRNKVLVAATIGILIGAGTVNGLGFLLSIYFQDPATLGMSPFEAGLATLPLTVALVVVAPLVVGLAHKFGVGAVVGGGFAVSTLGFLVLCFVGASWSYVAFVLPMVAVAAGLGLSNGPCSSLATSAVPADEVGAASGVSNMARYVGASVMVAVTAALYGSAGAGDADALADGFARASVGLTVVSAAGVALVALIARHRMRRPRPVDRAAAAAVTTHTVSH
ncbi:MFS transporter [Virgisporangium ochraceum]|uniref:MFS transporter n=1 Tax=Virgisporangium ochraceum TaxID=65505 RepID=A0A8J4A116_9ACTN|nr:MFS transporter [Virgisporangium ochraceum]GIJ72637.1 MFS transporter [Virgisporangium ochraceum]